MSFVLLMFEGNAAGYLGEKVDQLGKEYCDRCEIVN